MVSRQLDQKWYREVPSMIGPFGISRCALFQLYRQSIKSIRIATTQPDHNVMVLYTLLLLYTCPVPL